MVGKIKYQEFRREPFKAYVKKQDTCCLRCKKRTDNKLITAKQVTHKSIAQKSIRADFGAKKLIFAKEYKPDKKIVFTNYKTCICIVKTVKNTQVTRFQKKFVLISKNKIKGKTKGVIYLTESILFYS